MRRFVVLVCCGALATSTLLMGAPVAGAASTRAEYAAQADPICKSNDKDFNRLWKRFLRLANQYPFKIQAAANTLERMGKRYSSSVNSLHLIAPPPGDEALIAQWLDLHSQSATKYPLAASAYRLNNYKRLNRLIDSADRLARHASSLVADWPFQRCA
jgi:hypothetical protein